MRSRYQCDRRAIFASKKFFLFFSMFAFDRSARSRGVLAARYKGEYGERLATTGVVIIHNAITSEKATELRTLFNDELCRMGYDWQFGPDGGKTSSSRAKDGPMHYKGLEICLLGLSYPANKSREATMAALATHIYHCSTTDLTPAFDGVQLTYNEYSKYNPKHNIDHHKGVSLLPAAMPTDPKKMKYGAGPAHWDVDVRESRTGMSMQAILPLTHVDEHDFGLAFMQPNAEQGWTIQGLIDCTRRRYPEQFVKTTGLSDTLVHPKILKWWIDAEMAIYKKYKLEPTDILLFDSHVVHCAVEPTPQSPTLRGRLGMLGGAVPRDLVNDKNAAKRMEIVGMQYRGTGQGIIDTNPHLAFPMSLHRIKPDDWPDNYKKLKRKRETIKQGKQPWYAAASSDTQEERENKRLVRGFLGVD